LRRFFQSNTCQPKVILNAVKNFIEKQKNTIMLKVISWLNEQQPLKWRTPWWSSWREEAKTWKRFTGSPPQTDHSIHHGPQHHGWWSEKSRPRSICCGGWIFRFLWWQAGRLFHGPKHWLAALAARATPDKASYSSSLQQSGWCGRNPLYNPVEVKRAIAKVDFHGLLCPKCFWPTHTSVGIWQQWNQSRRH
jgi:hypothetical protein